MNWTPEMVRVEMEYRVEQALGDARNRQRQAMLHDARADQPTWWQRLRAHHHTDNGERSAA